MKIQQAARSAYSGSYAFWGRMPAGGTGDSAGIEEVRTTAFSLLRISSYVGARMDTHQKGVQSSVLRINEARADEDLPPVPGGEIIFMQQQNWPLQDLANRAPPTDTLNPPAANDATIEEDEEDEDLNKGLIELCFGIQKRFDNAASQCLTNE